VEQAVIVAADVQRIAKRFGVDPRLIQAVVNAEGNIVRAVQISVPSVTTRDEAIEITCRSCVHAMSDFIQGKLVDASADEDSLLRDMRGTFIRAWASRWAPVGATNDPTSLNANWPRNVLRLWQED
jgi:hypothetical protein